MNPPRILVTGSRDWDDYMAVNRELAAYISEQAGLIVDSQGLPIPREEWVIVHGNCPSGADHWADQFALANLIEVERHPADWSLGRWAGFQRNREMVVAGADVCLAFIKPCRKESCRRPEVHGSHGASHTADLAEEAGIETRRFWRR